jgi:arginine decarboxylase-like protein
MLRFRFQYEYVIFNHLIVIFNQTNLFDNLNNFLINRIFQFIDHDQTFNERIEKLNKRFQTKILLNDSRRNSLHDIHITI